MKKHGASHGAAVLVCTFASALLVDVIKDYVPFIYKIVHRTSEMVIEWTGLNYKPRQLSVVIYAAFLSVVWGIAFSFMHSDKSD